MARHAKYKSGSIVLLRQLDQEGNLATIWGGEVIRAAPEELTVRAIEMVIDRTAQEAEWHATGEFTIVKAPPHKQPYQWDFPRLLVEGEASEFDRRARPVIEKALAIWKAKHPDEK